MTGLSSRILVAFTETVVMTESDDLSITVLKGMTEVIEYCLMKDRKSQTGFT